MQMTLATGRRDAVLGFERDGAIAWLRHLKTCPTPLMVVFTQDLLDEHSSTLALTTSKDGKSVLDAIPFYLRSAI